MNCYDFFLALGFYFETMLSSVVFIDVYHLDEKEYLKKLLKWTQIFSLPKVRTLFCN